MNINIDEILGFEWQAGYGAFSVAQSNLKSIVSYIKNQKKYHKTQSLEDEYIKLNNKNGVLYDERHLWG